MRTRIIVAALVVAAVSLGAMASSAFAATTIQTAPNHWEKGETVISKAEAAKCAASETFTLKSKVLGAELEVQATGLECLETTIFNAEVEVEGKKITMASASGKLKFTGVSVLKPAGCKIASTLTTETINGTVDEHLIDGVPTIKEYKTTKPASGTKFVSIKLEGCAAAGTYSLTGTVVGLGTTDTGTSAKNHPVVFNTETNATSELKLGKESASIFGAASFELSSGEEFRLTNK